MYMQSPTAKNTWASGSESGGGDGEDFDTIEIQITYQEAVDLSEDSSGSTITEDNKQSPGTGGGSIEVQEELASLALLPSDIGIGIGVSSNISSGSSSSSSSSTSSSSAVGSGKSDISSSISSSQDRYTYSEEIRYDSIIKFSQSDKNRCSSTI